ncbi:MAG: hypothetical protein R2778_04205 [Saprospiraceae bacterium]
MAIDATSFIKEKNSASFLLIRHSRIISFQIPPKWRLVGEYCTEVSSNGHGAHFNCVALIFWNIREGDVKQEYSPMSR